MSGVTRKLLGGVLAISLFICSSLSAFADLITVNPSFPTLQYIALLDSNNSVLSKYDISSDNNVVHLENGGYSNFSYYSDDPFSLGSNNGVSYINLQTNVHSSSVQISSNDVINIDPVLPSSGYYVVTMSFLSDFDITTLSNLILRLRVYDYNDTTSTSSRIRYDVYPDFEVDSVSSDDGYFYNTIKLYLDFPSFYSDDESLLNRIQFNYLVLNLPVGALYRSFNFTASSFTQFDNGTNNILLNGFDRVISTLRSLISKDDHNYTAVTDPATSQEIQDTQDMIDDVEDFEASLNQNITTEFNKIDFTTPTNLAAPVAFVADKVTRSVNALGSGYQPLVFVPLTLGIMLIFLGRGVTALGQMRPSSRFDPLDHIRDNSRDERWLW